MRPRFSLKWLLIAFTTLGGAFYAAFVRPTVVASRFVNAIDDGDYSALETAAIFGDHDLKNAQELGTDHFTGSRMTSIRTRLVPRSWMDLLACRRWIWLELCYHESASVGLTDEWQVMDLALAVAGPVGVNPRTFELNDAFPR